MSAVADFQAGVRSGLVVALETGYVLTTRIARRLSRTVSIEPLMYGMSNQNCVFICLFGWTGVTDRNLL